MNYDHKILMFAVHKKNPEMIELLIEAGANVDYNNGRPLLKEAAILWDEECLKILIDAGADVNAIGWHYRISSLENESSAIRKSEILSQSLF